MSRIHRLLLIDRIFFVNVNLRRMHHDFRDSEYPVILKVIDESRQRHKFLFCGYVLMPDHWHALIWPRSPEPIYESMHDMKKVSSQRLQRAGRTVRSGSINFGTASCATPRSFASAWTTCT